MKFQRKKVAVALANTLNAGIALGLISAPALSQAQTLTREVTGSRISTIAGETALPVQIFTRDDIERTGATTAFDLMQYVSANNTLGTINASSAIGATTFGLQTASLRGLGGGATLVLINGQRQVSFAGEVAGTGGGVDLNSIPFSAIERVEILKDGASAIYGSDAVAGVINFITRQDYRGAEATVYYAAPTRSGGGNTTNIQATAGWGDLAKDKFNFFISGAYNDQQEIYGRDRSFGATSIFNLPPSSSDYQDRTSGNTFPGNISTSSTGAIWNPAYPNCSPSVQSPTSTGLCRYDPQVVAEIVPSVQSGSLFGSFRYQINNDWQVYATATASQTKQQIIVQAVPISDQFPLVANNPVFDLYGTGAVIILPTSPFYPTAGAAAHGVAGQPLNVRWRCVECGNRDTTDTNDQYSIVAGIKGSWKTWDIQGNFIYGESKTKEQLNGGFPQYSKIFPLINGGQVNLFGANTPAIQAQLQATDFNGETFNSKGTLTGFDVSGSSEIWKLPAGPMSIAIGGDVYRQDFQQNPNPILQTGDVSGYGGNFLNVDQSRDIWALFAELNIPIVKNLEGNVAVRYDHYSDFGSTTNPKVSLRWQPMKSVLFRASYGTGFLAPTLLQLWNPNTQGVTTNGLSDPLRCPTTNSSNDCSTQFTTVLGGNPNLKPQESEQMTFGVILEPIDGLSLGFDLFKINLSQQILSGLSADFILDHLSQYGNLVTRAPPAAPFPGLPGQITSINQTNLNLGNVHISGVDVDVKYIFPRTDYGRFTFTLNGTYYYHYAFENPDGTYTGTVGMPGASPSSAASVGVIPRWKHYATLAWTNGPWQASVAQTFIDSYTDFNTDNNGNNRDVGTLSLWDIQGIYTGFKNFTLTAGVKNLFDTNPPFTNTFNDNFQSSYDIANYDSRARFLYGSIKYAFAGW